MLNIEKNSKAKGFIKLLRTNLSTGVTETLVDKPNLILYSGADLLAYSLAGYPNAKISHMYIGYNDGNGTFTAPTVDLQDSSPIQDYASPFGYIRLPLTFPASYLNTTNYTHNIPVFSVSISSATAQGGAPFQGSGLPGPSWIYEVALVAALDPTSDNNDVVFSRAQFTPVQYDPSFALTLQWGVQFESN